MKVTLDEFPPYYKQYPWSPVPDQVNYFVGREIELMGFWYEMANLMGTGQKQHANLAFVGQRKLGKTAYLKRCYNIAFWEQDEVVPFYYSFAQNEQDETKNVLQIKDLQRDMPLILLRQFFAFCTKDKYFFEIKSTSKLLSYAKKTKFPRLEELMSGIETCLDLINTSERIFILRDIWEMTQWLSLFVDKKCLLVIDEAQEMQVSIYDGKEQFTCKGSIADIIQKQHSLVLVSGSHVSMLVNDFLDYDFANRIQDVVFTTLEDKDAKELIHRKCANGYKKLADDLIALVGGNPYYINQVLSFSMKYIKTFEKQKDFSSREGLQKAYDFEVFHRQGIINKFWNTHLIKNKEDLNRDPKTKKGLTLQLLYKIAKNPNKEFYYHDLTSEFEIDEKMLEAKLQQLENANLITPTGISRFAYGFPDKILPLIINKVYYDLLLKGPNKKVAQEAFEDFLASKKHFEKDAGEFTEYINEARKRLKIAKKEVTKRMSSIQLEVASLKKSVNKIQGTINFKKGMKAENNIRKKVRKMIENQEGLFANFELEGEVQSINIAGSKGKGCQIDVYAKLRKQGKGKKKEYLTFMAEIKNTKTKISLAQVKKFAASITKVKDEHKIKDISAIYISEAGFSKTAVAYLKKHNITCANSEEIFV